MLFQTKLINRNKFHGKLRKEKMQDPLKLRTWRPVPASRWTSVQGVKFRVSKRCSGKTINSLFAPEEDVRFLLRCIVHNAKQESSGAVCYSTSVRRSWTMQGAALFFPLPPSLSLRPPLPFFVKLLTSLARAFSI